MTALLPPVEVSRTVLLVFVAAGAIVSIDPSRRKSGAVRDFSPEATFPAATHVAWLLGQMMRWKHLPSGTNVLATATASVNTARVARPRGFRV